LVHFDGNIIAIGFRPDYETDSVCFFDLARLPELRRAIADHRQQHWLT
jgi:hypothetical protein